jgi:hypothetical protein
VKNDGKVDQFITTVMNKDEDNDGLKKTIKIYQQNLLDLELKFRDMFALNHKLGVELTEKVCELAALRQTAVKNSEKEELVPSYMKVMDAEQQLADRIDSMLLNSSTSPDFILKKNAMKRSIDNYHYIVQQHSN